MAKGQVIGQQAIDLGVEREPSGHAETLDVQLSLSRVLTPDYQHMEAADFGEVGPAEIAAADPVRLRTGLIDIPGHPHAVRFQFFDEQAGRTRSATVALSAEEDDVVMRTQDPADYARRAYNSAMKKAGLVGEERARADAERKAVESVDTKRERIAGYIEATLQPELARLGRFDEYARSFEKRRLKGVNFDAELAWIRHAIFGGMLSVIGEGRQWTDDQRRVADKAVDWRIFFDPQSRNRIRNFHAMNRLALEYFGLKIALFSDREARAGAYVRQHAFVKP